jgi:hypothetical protein
MGSLEPIVNILTVLTVLSVAAERVTNVVKPLCANVRETPENCLIREEGEKVSMNVDVSERYGKS